MQVAIANLSPTRSIPMVFPLTGVLRLKDSVFEVREKALISLRGIDTAASCNSLVHASASAAILRCCNATQKLDFQSFCLSQLQVIVSKRLFAQRFVLTIFVFSQ